MRQIMFVLLLIAAVASGYGADKKPALFTGNASVDFFSRTAPVYASKLGDTTMSMLTEETATNKSPWIAAGLSLLVPGAGEVYTHSYLKAGIFAAAEVASIVLAVTYNKRGDDQTTFFEAYADQHYSAARYARWTMANINTLNPSIANADSYKVFTNGSTASSIPYTNMDWSQLNRMESDVANGVTNGYTHRMPNWGAQQFYELIGKYDQFSAGWDDADTSEILDLPITDRTNHEDGKQSQQRYYMDQRAQANHYYDLAGTYVGILVANHILSAIDAYWSATRYNHALHASVEMKLQPSQYGLVPVPTAHLQYDF